MPPADGFRAQAAGHSGSDDASKRRATERQRTSRVTSSHF
ncbi:hypothetical protein BURPS1710A_1083 [Burkholderia pseudomallei 1710a]|uniref:Uncharacterized protein n=1 Tax=Burkholderia pseudomallei 1710a TaxID=320371 RepID=A0A0E1W3E5_BURPE|nr:hypothetical protein BURPS1710A_1083 [Burkholderia pseudomallei 1710a]